MAIDAEVMRLAERRNNLVKVADLLELGLSRRQIRARIALAWLFPVHPGVMSLVSPPLDFETRAAAACLAVPCGVISFSAAAFLHGIRRSPREWMDMTLPANRIGRIDGIHFHRTNQLPDRDVMHRINGIRLTTPARSLFDLGSVLDGPGLRSAIEDARHRGLVSDLELDEVGARLIRPGRPGSAMFRQVVDPLLGEVPTQSGYEVIVREALVEAGLVPAIQHRLRLPNGREVFLDLALLESRVDVEIDHAWTHSSPQAVGADKARDVQVLLAGWQPIRFTDEDVRRRLRSVVGHVGAIHRRRLAA